MADIDVLIPPRPQRWQRLVAERLVERGHRVRIVESAPAPEPLAARLVVGLESKLFTRDDRLSAEVEPMPAGSSASIPALTVDLTGANANRPPPVLSIRFDGWSTPAGGLATIVHGGHPVLHVVRDATVVASAAPMIEDPGITVRGYESMLARAVTLMVVTADRFARNPNALPAQSAAATPSRGILPGYAFNAVPRLAREILRRTRYHYGHWRVGYRLSDGPYVPATHTVGNGWQVLPDDGSRFYADPFPFTHEGRQYVFVEDYPHATQKAVLSVSELVGGVLQKPRLVLEEPFHLSYPQVFARDGEIWMIPEGIGGRSLVLYRAVAFPDRWERHTVLVDNCEICDASLFEHNGRLWLIGTGRDGYGSTSDLMVVYSTERLTGPWQPHPLNPIIIDRAAARPGGAVFSDGNRLLIPLQDGTRRYGDGLGLAEITRLDETHVEITRPHAIVGSTDFPYPAIHTYNRDGRLEVIDGIAAVRKGQSASSSS